MSRRGIARRRWGVAGLPWLILADEKHVATAEGFSVDGLDDLLAPTPAQAARSGISQ